MDIVIAKIQLLFVVTLIQHLFLKIIYLALVSISSQIFAICTTKKSCNLYYNLFFSPLDAKLSLRSIYIYNATIENFNINMEEWIRLESLSIIEGHIKTFQGRFNELNLSCMNFSGNGIVDVGPETFTRLHKLRILDFSRNNLTNIPNIILNKKKEFILDISSM